VLFFVHGKSGNNGKSTLVSPVRDMLGDYGSHTPTETLLTKQYDNNIPADLARPRAASCRMSLSNVKSETALRSRLFSSSRSFSRFTCSSSGEQRKRERNPKGLGGFEAADQPVCHL